MRPLPAFSHQNFKNPNFHIPPCFFRFINRIFLSAIILGFSFGNFAGCAGTNSGRDAPGPPRGYPAHWLMKAAYAIGLLDLVDVKPAIPETIHEFKNIEYKQIDGHSLMLDVYQLKNLKQPRPCLIFIHGGGWKGGNRGDYLRYLVDFAEQGYVTVTVTYRLSKAAIFPAAVNDVKCAVKWIRAHAKEYLINPNKLAVIGGSAGGHLSTMVGYSPDEPMFEECDVDSVSSRVQAVVNLYGAVDLTTDFARNNPLTHKFLGHKYSEAPDIYKKASPLTYITADDPPTLIFHGTLDKIVPVGQSDSLKIKLDAAGVPNEYHRLKGWPHTMDLGASVNQYCQYYMRAFFEKYIPIGDD